MHRLFIRTASVVLLAAVLSQAVAAQEASLRVMGTLDAFTRSANIKRATDLVPVPPRSDSHGVEATLRPTAQTGALTSTAQFRIAFDSETDPKLHVDEAYAELLLGDHIFAFVGRRILSWGQSYGLNPADIFQKPLQENPVFPQSQARGRVEGDDMAGTDILFDSGNTLTLLYVPEFARRDTEPEEGFALARFSGFAFDSSLDYAVSTFGGDRSGVGLSLNYVIGDASVVYLDGTFRKGREKQTIGTISSSGALILDPRESNGVYPYVTLGLGHTVGNGFSVNLEYTHDAGGYSTSEWHDISAALDQVTPVASAIHSQTLGQLNGLLNHYTLRKNYAFARMVHDGVFRSKLAAEMTMLHGIDDKSGALRFRLEYPVADQITLGLQATRKYGPRNAEFTLRPETGTFAFYVSSKF